jgi:hypothetical protein
MDGKPVASFYYRLKGAAMTIGPFGSEQEASDSATAGYPAQDVEILKEEGGTFTVIAPEQDAMQAVREAIRLVDRLNC